MSDCEAESNMNGKKIQQDSMARFIYIKSDKFNKKIPITSALAIWWCITFYFSRWHYYQCTTQIQAHNTKCIKYSAVLNAVSDLSRRKKNTVMAYSHESIQFEKERG